MNFFCCEGLDNQNLNEELYRPKYSNYNYTSSSSQATTYGSSEKNPEQRQSNKNIFSPERFKKRSIYHPVPQQFKIQTCTVPKQFTRFSGQKINKPVIKPTTPITSLSNFLDQHDYNNFPDARIPYGVFPRRGSTISNN